MTAFACCNYILLFAAVSLLDLLWLCKKVMNKDAVHV